MSTQETEDGFGCSGMVPTAAEKREEARAAKIEHERELFRRIGERAIEACRAVLHEHEQTYDGEPLSMGRAHAIQLCERAVALAEGRPAPQWDENLAAIAERQLRREQRLANTAPELLAALERMVDKATRQNWNDAYPEQLAQAFAAIAKATQP